MFSFISLCLVFIYSFILQLNSVISVSIPITSVLNSSSDRLSISSSLSSFSGVLICSFIWAIFLCACLLHCKGQRGICQSRITFFATLWCCMRGRSQRRNNATCLVLTPLSITSLTPHKWIVPFQVLLPQVSGFVYILGPCVSLQRTLL